MGAAMKYEISEQGTTAEIRVQDAGNQRSSLLQALGECRSGSCGCPSDQYERLANLDVDATDHNVTLRLEPRPGQRLDPEQLCECLDHTLAQITSQSPKTGRPTA
jgi:hypothetical protein